VPLHATLYDQWLTAFPPVVRGLSLIDPHVLNSSLRQRETTPKRHLDRFSRFSTAHVCAQHTQTQTDTQTTLRTVVRAFWRVGARPLES